MAFGEPSCKLCLYGCGFSFCSTNAVLEFNPDKTKICGLQRRETQKQISEYEV